MLSICVALSGTVGATRPVSGCRTLLGPANPGFRFDVCAGPRHQNTSDKILMIQFNPFGKPLSELSGGDLGVLRSISEGWYVEYKQEVTDVGSIAKSVSAFANHYGGWLFYGIAESLDGQNLAGSFPGISNNKVGLALERIRNAVATYINPSPYYDFRTIEGPVEEIGLPAEHCILVILVPSSANPPHVHGTGRIYRRVADASSPKHETDRSVLDQLWERRQRNRDSARSFLETAMEHSDAESGTSFLTVFLVSDLYGERGHQLKIELEEFATIMGSREGEFGDFTCDNIFTMPGGFVARQVMGNDPTRSVLTWRHYANASSIITIPIRASRGFDESRRVLAEYLHTERFLACCTLAGLKHLELLDLNLLYNLLGAIVVKHRRLAQANGIQDSLFFKARIENVFGRLPFLDVPEYVAHVEKFGVPIVQQSMLITPADPDPTGMLDIGPTTDDAEDQDPSISRLLEALLPFMYVANALGVPRRCVFTPENLKATMPALIDASLVRGVRAHASRPELG